MRLATHYFAMKIREPPVVRKERLGTHDQVGNASLRGLDAPAPADFFELLNLDSNAASSADVRASYRTLQRAVHPDIAGMQLIVLAQFFERERNRKYLLKSLSMKHCLATTMLW